MLCDVCKKNQATYHSMQVINGHRSESHLCQGCLSAQQGQESAHANLLSGLLGQTPKTTPLRCSLCGMEYGRFQQTGKLGCAQCYQDFRSQLTPTLQRIHGNVHHQGHVPASAGEALKARKLIDALQKEMQEAVQAEDFERAAQVRDMLREAQKELERIQHPFGGVKDEAAQQAADAATEGKEKADEAD